MKKLPFILITLLILGCIESPKKSEIIEQPSPKTFTVKEEKYISIVRGYPWEEDFYPYGRPIFHQMFDSIFN